MFEYIGQAIDYRRKSKDPAAWFSVGFTLYFAAHVLWDRLRPALHAWQPGANLTAEQELALRLRGPFAMLAGMAIEDMLKGAIVQAMPPSHRAVPPRGHNLVEFSELAKITWDDSQIDLLKRLTTFIVWAGRYPVALTERSSQAPRSLKDTDYATIVGVAKYLFDLHHGKGAPT